MDEILPLLLFSNIWFSTEISLKERLRKQNFHLKLLIQLLRLKSWWKYHEKIPIHTAGFREWNDAKDWIY